MKHLHSNRILGRVAAKRKELLRSLSVSLLTHGAIVTTEAKAKELRTFFEPLVTKAREEATLHRRRQLLSALPKPQVEQLLEVAKKHQTRPGGYLRLTRVPATRQDASKMMKVTIIGYEKANS
jgi:large subunit ribosomal protein L17